MQRSLIAESQRKLLRSMKGTSQGKTSPAPEPVRCRRVVASHPRPQCALNQFSQHSPPPRADAPDPVKLTAPITLCEHWVEFTPEAALNPDKDGQEVGLELGLPEPKCFRQFRVRRET